VLGSDGRRLATQLERGRITRRDFILRAAALGLSASAVGSVLASCGDEQGGGNQGGDENVTLRWLSVVGTPGETPVYRKIAEGVTKTHPNIEVDLQTVPIQGYNDSVLTRGASGDLPDLIWINADAVSAFASRNLLAPIQDRIQNDADLDLDDFFKPYVDSLAYQDSAYGLPFKGLVFIQYVNLDLFEREGVEPPSPTKPMNRNQFLDMLKRMTKPDKRQYGLTTFAHFAWADSYMRCNGGRMYNEALTDCTIDSPKSLEAMRFFVDLFAKEKVAVPITDLADPGGPAFGAFIEGRTAIMQHASSLGLEIKEQLEFDFDLCPWPALSSAGSNVLSGGEGFAISAKSKHPDEAWQALKTITNADNQRLFYEEAGASPARRSASEAFYNQPPPPEHPKVPLQILAGENNTSAVPAAAPPIVSDVDRIWSNQMLPLFQGRGDFEATIRDYARQIDELIKK